MRPKLLHRNPNGYVESLAFQHYEAKNFLPLWHYHPELELVLVRQGAGDCFVGDSIFTFGPGTLVLLGANLAHKWLNDPSHFKAGNDLVAESFTIHFARDFLQVNLSLIPEFKSLIHLIEKSQLGILFSEQLAAHIGAALEQMSRQTAFDRLISFLQILRELAEDEDCQPLVSPGYVKMHLATDDRLGRVHSYIMNHFQDDISLDQIAEVAHMNRTAFCRYFKRRTKKSFSRYLHEIRIGYACKLLNEREEQTITEVCFACGYNSISNFNRQFKLITGYAPTSYLAQHQSSNKER